MKKLLSLSLVLVILLVSLVSCGAAKESMAGDAYYDYDGAYKTESDYYYANDSKDYIELPAATTAAASSGVTSPEPADRKQIKNATMRIQTKEYEQFMKDLSTIVDNYGGYIQSSSQNGSHYGSTANRSSYVVARIPAESFELFKAAISEKCNVVYLDEGVRDVTTVYTSLESKISVLEAEESSLIAMLENTQKYIDADSKNYTELISTMLTIKDQLLSVQSQLASYRSELKSYASQVAYSTFSMNISEVDRLVAVEEPKTVWEEIGTKLSDNLYSIGQGARNFFVWLVTSLPYIIIWAVIITAAVFTIIKISKNTSKRSSSPKPKNKNGDGKSEQE